MHTETLDPKNQRVICPISILNRRYVLMIEQLGDFKEFV